MYDTYDVHTMYDIGTIYYCKPKYFSGKNIIAFCSNQQYF